MLLGIFSFFIGLSLIYANPFYPTPSFTEETITSAVYCRKEGYSLSSFFIVEGEVSATVRARPVVIGFMKQDVNNTGWAYLNVQTTEIFDDITQAYFAGLIEGKLTYDLIKAHYQNTAAGVCPQPLSKNCLALKTYIDKNFDWMKSQVLMNFKSDPFWHQIGLQIWQIKGLEDAISNRAKTNPEELTMEAFKKITFDTFGIYFMQLAGDVAAISDALGFPEIRSKIVFSSCSSLVKLMPYNDDIYFSHVTWSSLESMLRVIKQYKFAFHTTGDINSDRVPGGIMTFTSYPGVASSGDDFYVLESGLATMETTIGNNNKSLWSIVRDGAERNVLEVFRTQTANRLASKGSEWVDYFSKFNSGTYNNQWMILDYNHFSPGQTSFEEGLLTVAEQIPGKVKSADVSSVLFKDTYWASYNIPYFPDVYRESGWEDLRTKYGDFYSFSKSPRAQIFARNHSSVVDIQSMIRLMRYNDYQNDPLAACDCTPPYSGENAIAARSDLNPPDGVYPFGALGYRDHAATDMKLVTYQYSKSLNFIAQSGPTFDQQPAFNWLKSTFRNIPHNLHPIEFRFDPIVTPFS